MLQEDADASQPPAGARLTSDATRGAPQAATTGARFDPTGPQPQPALAIPTGPSKPAHDAFLLSLPQVTTALVVPPIGAGSPATATQAASGATSGIEPGRPGQPRNALRVLTAEASHDNGSEVRVVRADFGTFLLAAAGASVPAFIAARLVALLAPPIAPVAFWLVWLYFLPKIYRDLL
jgi:hypothetical protein